MQITRNTLETGAGPADWFTGSVGEHVSDERYGQAPSTTEGEN